MRKMIALFVSIAFSLGVVGYAAAQTSTAPAPAPEKKMSKKADCLQKAGSDEAKKADCEKKYAAKKPAKKDATTAQKKPDDKK
jgi:hypothetical protein